MYFEENQKTKKMLPVLVFGFTVILTVILASSIFTVIESGNALKRALVIDSFQVAEEILNSINKDIYHHITDLQDLATGDGLIKLLEDRKKNYHVEKESGGEPVTENIKKTDQKSERALSNRLRRKFMLEDFRQFGHNVFSTVTVFDCRGIPVASTDEAPEPVSFDTDRLEIINEYGYLFKDIGRLDNDGNVGVEVFFEVQGGDGACEGMVRGGLDVRGLIAKSALLLGARGNYELLLLSRQGQVLYASKVFRFLEDHGDKDYFVEIKRNISEQEGKIVDQAVILEGTQGENIYTYAQSKGHGLFPGFGWIFVVSRPVNEVFKPVIHQQKKLFIIFASLFFLQVIISFFVSRLVARKETRIIEERNYSNAIINSLPGIACVCDEQLRLTRWNANLETVSEIGSSALFHLNVSELFKHDSNVEKTFDRVFRYGTADSEFVVGSSGNKEMCFSVSGRLYDYGAGRLVVISGLDISKQKAIQDELRKKTDMLNERVKELGCLYSIQRLTNDNFLTVNEVCQSVADLVPTGFSRPKEVKVRIVLEGVRFCSSGFKESMVSIRSSLETRGQVRGVIEVFCTDDLYSIDESSLDYQTPFVAEEELLLEDIALKLGVFVEYREADKQRKRIHGELERSNKELEQFAYVASHDLQEPIRMISSYTQLLEEKYRDRLDEKANKFIGYIVDGANRMNKLIQDLLTFSRITTRGGVIEVTEMGSVLENVVANCRTIIEESGANINYGKLPAVLADSSQILQLFQNLISNAIKFRSEKIPEIIIEATIIDGQHLFSVRDNGIGIEQKYSEKIFTIFQRLHTREEYPGTGIGLALCKRIIERHGGRIWFESQPGQGTVFFFTLPVLDIERS